MFLREEYKKISKRLVAVLTDQIQKLMTKSKDVDLHFNPEDIIADLMMKAHREGYRKGKKEMQLIMDDFNDISKDPKDN